MSEVNYEAIGRCKVLKEEISELQKKQTAAASALRSTMRPIWGGSVSSKKDIVTFDADAMYDQLKALEDTSKALLLKATEFNDWAHKAGERPYSIGHTP